MQRTGSADVHLEIIGIIQNLEIIGIIQILSDFCCKLLVNNVTLKHGFVKLCKFSAININPCLHILLLHAF